MEKVIEEFNKEFECDKHMGGLYHYSSEIDRNIEVQKFILKALSYQESELKAQWRKEIDWLGKEQFGVWM